MIFSNENILKLIFSSSTLFEIRGKLNIVYSKLLYKLILSMIDFSRIYKSLGRSKHIMPGHTDEIYSLTLLPNTNLVSVSKDNTLKVWDMDTYLCIKTLKHEGPVTSIILLINGNIATCTWNKHIKIFSIDDDFTCLKTIHVHGFGDYDALIQLSDGNIACTAKQNNDYCIIILDNNNDYNCIKVLRGHLAYILCFANLPNDKFASGSRDAKINIWDINDEYNHIKRTLKGHGDWVLSLLVIPNKDILLSGSKDKTIRVWNIINYDCIEEIKSHINSVRSLLLLPNGYIAAGYWYGCIKIWNLNDFEWVNTLEEHQNDITSLLLIKDGRIISASADKRIIIWKY
jgi:WD40 repeat protein